MQQVPIQLESEREFGTIWCTTMQLACQLLCGASRCVGAGVHRLRHQPMPAAVPPALTPIRSPLPNNSSAPTPPHRLAAVPAPVPTPPPSPSAFPKSAAALSACCFVLCSQLHTGCLQCEVKPGFTALYQPTCTPRVRMHSLLNPAMVMPVCVTCCESC